MRVGCDPGAWLSLREESLRFNICLLIARNVVGNVVGALMGGNFQAHN